MQDKLLENEKIIRGMNYEKENFRFLSEMSLEFSRARTSGDINKLKSLVSNNIEILEKDNEIFAKWKIDEQEIEYPLYTKIRMKTYKDMQINGYDYNEKEDKFDIYVQEYFTNSAKEIVGIGFINLHFERINNEWKISRFEYDI
ncbi:MAG: hypothetical protein N4A63_13040 [Vallitalea sp.]|nr:hypothetical protein [Vallitalea sp.]